MDIWLLLKKLYESLDHDVKYGSWDDIAWAMDRIVDFWIYIVDKPEALLSRLLLEWCGKYLSEEDQFIERESFRGRMNWWENADLLIRPSD